MYLKKEYISLLENNYNVDIVKKLDSFMKENECILPEELSIKLSNLTSKKI